MRRLALAAAALALVFPGAAAAHHRPPIYQPPAIESPAIETVEGDRFLFCDLNGRAWDLVWGQQWQEPWTVLQLRLANRGLPGNPDAVWCPG